MARMRYHSVLHILNTIALHDYQGWITGVQIGVDYSRIDFKLENFSAAICTELEQNLCDPGGCFPPARGSAQDAGGQTTHLTWAGAGGGDRGV
jgi:hypothetical protein